MISKRNLTIGIVIITVGAISFYFGSQNTTSSSTEKTLELTTVKISKGDLAKKEEYVNNQLKEMVADLKRSNFPEGTEVHINPADNAINISVINYVKRFRSHTFAISSNLK